MAEEEEASLQAPLLAAEEGAVDDGANESLKNTQWAQWALMGSYSMGAWAWRSWEFAVAQLLIYLYPDSLLMVSIYGLVDNGVRITAGPRVGKFISRHDLLPGATTMYLAQNVCIGVSAASALVLLLIQEGTLTLPDQVYWPLMVIMVLLGALSSIGSSGLRIAVEAEAVSAIAAGNQARMSTLNAGFRAIDLTCLLAAPMVVGGAITWLSPPAATLLLASYTMLAWIPELLLIKTAVNLSPVLRDFKKNRQTNAQTTPEGAQNGEDGYTPPSQRPPQRRVCCKSLRTYLSQDVLLPQLSMAFLYCTVLSLGFLMSGYLKWTGMSSAEVSAYRGIGAITGLAATGIYPAMNARLGAVTTGMIGITYQLLCLAVGVIPMAVEALMQPGGPQGFQPSAGLVRELIGGVVASRTGLWVVDLATTQLVQVRVASEDLGVVCGVQSSLQAAFETLSFLAGVYLHDPTLFYWLMMGSLCVVTAAFSLFALYALREGCCRTVPAVARSS